MAVMSAETDRRQVRGRRCFWRLEARVRAVRAVRGVRALREIMGPRALPGSGRRGGDGAGSHMTVQALDGSMSAEYLHRFRSGHDLTIETGSEPGHDAVEAGLLRLWLSAGARGPQPTTVVIRQRGSRCACARGSGPPGRSRRRSSAGRHRRRSGGACRWHRSGADPEPTAWCSQR